MTLYHQRLWATPLGHLSLHGTPCHAWKCSSFIMGYRYIWLGYIQVGGTLRMPDMHMTHTRHTHDTHTTPPQQQRNWTSKYYNAKAEKWDLCFFQDSGRFMRGAFPGFRCLVTRADGSQCWVNLPHAGSAHFLTDYTSSATKGALVTPKAHAWPPSIADYGYNQVW